MSLSNSTLEPAEAVLRRVERDTYSVADVRKALSYLLAHVEKGDAPPTPWVVADKILMMPAMYYPLKAAWEGIEKIPVEARRAAIAVYEPPRKGGAKSSINIFSDDEEDILVSFCNIALEGTFRVSKEFVHELMWAGYDIFGSVRECESGAHSTSPQRNSVSKHLR
jgi:hypothetical protein